MLPCLVNKDVYKCELAVVLAYVSNHRQYTMINL